MLVNWQDVLDGEIVNAAWAVASMVAKPRAARQAAADLDTAAWADTGQLIRDALEGIAADPEMPDLSEQETAELTAIFKRYEVQGALQALLAVRLTDGPETDAVKARAAVSLALGRVTGLIAPVPPALPSPQPLPRHAPAEAESPDDPERTRGAERLSEYLDGRICALVAALEGQVGFAGLAQVRAEAYNSRVVALLGAIERQVTALGAARRGTQAETELVERYRRQVRLRHGSLVPPDFDRRRRIPVADIYVPTGIKDNVYFEADRRAPGEERPPLNVWDLVRLIDRTVLLGDPGGGKTTAANVLTDRFAADRAARIPFLVTLREYAAETPIRWSVAEHVGQNLKALYQTHPPDGLVERLLLTGQAVVIFDGLDELLDTSRRRDVSDRVEQFCSAYPLTPVLVTSRVVGYDQARLDDTQFTCYRLGGFGDNEVAAYARKWFATQDGVPLAEATAKADAFLAESSNAQDLRANPLLLSLMCILYRGAGSLPGDRAGVYAECARLLLRKWDEHRDLYRKVQADHLIEPVLRFLAWWLLTREDSQTAATERALVDKAAEFLHGRGYETEDEAQAAAREFIEFCRGRMWVFSDAGTTADGEKLYGFTHRTFLEYFAAGQLAVTSDTPEDLARALVANKVLIRGDVVGELAIKLKSDVSDRGVDRIYTALLTLTETLDANDRSLLLAFLIRSVDGNRPSPGTVRNLVKSVLGYLFSDGPATKALESAELLFGYNGYYAKTMTDEASSYLSGTTSPGGSPQLKDSILVILLASWVAKRSSLWWRWSAAAAVLYQEAIEVKATNDLEFRKWALVDELLPLDRALAMLGGLRALVEVGHHVAAGGISITAMTWRTCEDRSAFTVIGHYLIENPQPPWVILQRSAIPLIGTYPAQPPEKLDKVAFLGMAAMICIGGEISASPDNFFLLNEDSVLDELRPYLTRRTGEEHSKLPDLPVPDEFRRVFHDWAEHRVNFAEILGD